jgi:hypothetical protein
VHRESKARRRFHTDRIVRARRARDRNETPDEAFAIDRRLAYGWLANRDPWDCGHTGCPICNPRDPGRRAREERLWREDWEL